jgi:hypothetical protein
MRFRLAGSIALIAFAALPLACSTTVTVTTPTGCTVDNSLACVNGAQGFRCAAGDNPEVEDSSLSCSVPQPDGPDDDFCCFQWTFGTSSCRPDNTITAACSFPSFGYQCAAGDDPTSLDSSLNCSVGVLDPDGVSTDFCCN